MCHMQYFFNKCKEVLKKHIVYEVKYISKANDNFSDITDLDEYDREEISFNYKKLYY